MLRLIALVSASMLASIACNAHPAQSSGGQAGSTAGSGSAPAAPPLAKPAPRSVLEQVQQWAPEGTRVAAAELAVPGIELFALSDGKAAPEDEVILAKLVGVAGGIGGKVLDGRDLVRAVIEAKPDRKTLAKLALWVAQDDGEVLDGPNSPEQKAAKVRSPAVVNNALVFWVLTTDVPRMIEKATLDLATGALELAPLPVPQKIAIDNAMTTLGSVAVSRHVNAVRTLAAACADPRARQALLSALENHPRVKTRAAVADEAHRCGAAAVGALINAMEHDRSGLVRRQAAAALGRIGDPRARPALAKAVRGEDANLAYTAGNALKKIP